MSRRAALVAVVLPALLAVGPPAPAQRPSSRWESQRMPGVPFEEIERRSADALAAGRTDEAARYFAAGVALNPRWADGYWRLALIAFDAERYDEARDAIERLLPLEPPSGPSLALLGLAQYKLGSFDEARETLLRAIAVGVPLDQPIGREAAHQLALLLVRAGRTAEAARYLERLVGLEPDDPELAAACGLMALRLRKLPSEVTSAEAGLVAAAGRATLAALGYRDEEARRLFAELVSRFPSARGAHYAYGLYLSRHASPEALPLLQQEVALFPDNGEAQLELAFAILERGEAKDALVPARAAAALAPESAPAHLALGRALLAAGSLADATRELERSAELAPNVRDVQLALAQAYARAGRTADVARARAKLIELDAVRSGPR